VASKSTGTTGTRREWGGSKFGGLVGRGDKKCEHWQLLLHNSGPTFPRITQSRIVQIQKMHFCDQYKLVLQM
jgi:hypothetical protein